MNHGIAMDTLGETAISEELAKDFDIVLRIAPTLSRGLRGNPRQLKRFLNTLVLRLQTASRRGATLNPEILARLMVLEIVAPKGFQQLFNWQLAQDGTPDELAAAETAARTDTSLPEGSSNELQSWFGLEAVQNGSGSIRRSQQWAWASTSSSAVTPCRHRRPPPDCRQSFKICWASCRQR